ncbi:unnamed protein product, partial [Citrullus colocynthis]
MADLCAGERRTAVGACCERSTNDANSKRRLFYERIVDWDRRTESGSARGKGIDGERERPATVYSLEGER